MEEWSVESEELRTAKERREAEEKRRGKVRGVSVVGCCCLKMRERCGDGMNGGDLLQQWA